MAALQDTGLAVPVSAVAAPGELAVLDQGTSAGDPGFAGIDEPINQVESVGVTVNAVTVVHAVGLAVGNVWPRSNCRDERKRATDVTDYDDFAKAYSAENESNLFNAYYERPEMLRLAGDVSGRRILDAGCGSGPLTAALRESGAAVTGFDASAAMIDLARQRLGDDADLHVADLRAPLPFEDGQFDDVVASLVLHYLEDWSGPLAELRRVLEPGGRLILSVNHPSAYAIVYPEANYFAVTEYSEDHVMDGQTVWLTFYHRPLHAMTSAFAAAGFRITALSEPPPASNTPAELLPPALGEGDSFMCFLFFVLEAV